MTPDNSNPASALIQLRDVSKDCVTASANFSALKRINLDIHAGECVAVVGKSGSGKTTLINVLTGIDSSSTGTLRIDGRSIHQLSQEELAVWRGRSVGIVFQFFQLLPTLAIVENVALPMDFCRTYPDDQSARSGKAWEARGIEGAR
jgi:putative ABC transport system ATP-binding protein